MYYLDLKYHDISRQIIAGECERERVCVCVRLLAKLPNVGRKPSSPTRNLFNKVSDLASFYNMELLVIRQNEMTI